VAEPAQDEVLIRSLIGRAANIGDEGAPDDYRGVYTDDATWTMGEVCQTGIAEIVAAAKQRRENSVSGPGTDTRHLVVPMHVTVHGDTATAVSYFLFLANTSGTPVMKVFGVYTDELARVPAGWRLRHRVARAG
jgi:ketosteroid isomerase-like protein